LPNAPSPAAQPSGPLATLAQIASQISAPTPPPSPNNGSRPLPSHAAVRPEAAAGLDGWLVDRLFGRH